MFRHVMLHDRATLRPSKVTTVECESVEIRNYPRKCFVYETVHLRWIDDGWHVADEKTGRRLTSEAHSSREEAIEAAELRIEQRIASHGENWLDEKAENIAAWEAEFEAMKRFSR